MVATHLAGNRNLTVQGEQGQTDPKVSGNDTIPANTFPFDKEEHRVRITVRNLFDKENIFTHAGVKEVIAGGQNPSDLKETHLLHPLLQHGGILFPYTPMITATMMVNYNKYEPTHSIQDFMAYQRTPSPIFQITGDFTVQNIDEGRYALAVIHFLRVVTKMYFGRNTRNAGTPPPILSLSGYGQYMFNNVPIVITNYSINFEKEVDYVEIPITNNSKLDALAKNRRKRNIILGNCVNSSDGGSTKVGDKSKTSTSNVKSAWLPTKFFITVECNVTRSPQEARLFDLDDFRSGSLLSNRDKLIKTGGGWW